MKVALTFDDGPKEKYTDEILAVLEEHNVRATFFLLGMDAASRPEDAKKIINSGHLIANHSMNHRNLKKLDFSSARAELRECSELIKKLSGGKTVTRFMRPPGGQYSEAMIKACILEGLTPVFWTNNPGDYKGWNSAEDLAAKVIRSRRNGDIILLHLGLEVTVKALPMIIAEYRNAGFEFVTVDEL